MTATWEHRQGDELTRQAYLDAGDGAGIARAVEVSAETAYRGLTEDQQAIAREVFRRLTGTGPDRRPARRAVSISDLRAGRAAAQWPQISAVLEAFARHRLVVLDADRAEIAHDVLLRAWPRLRGWLAEDETSMILHGQLAEDTARWRASGGDRALLYRDVQLAAAAAGRARLGRGPGPVPPAGHRRGGVPAGQRPGRGSRPAAPAGPGRARDGGGRRRARGRRGGGQGREDQRGPAGHREHRAGPGRAEHGPRRRPTRSPPPSWPGPPGGWTPRRRPATACSSRWRSRSAAS